MIARFRQPSCIAVVLSYFIGVTSISLAGDRRIELDQQHAQSLRDAEAKVLESLSRRVSVDWRDSTLGTAVEELADTFDINVMFDERALATNGLSGEEPISIVAKDVSVRELLGMMCAPWRRQVGWGISGSFVLVTTRDEVNAMTRTRVYDVSKLLPRLSKAPAGGRFPVPQHFGETVGQAEATEPGDDIEESGSQPSAASYDFSPLIEMLEYQTGGDSWSSMGGEGEISPGVVGQTPLLVISQTSESHAEISALIAQLNSFHSATHKE